MKMERNVRYRSIVTWAGINVAAVLVLGFAGVDGSVLAAGTLIAGVGLMVWLLVSANWMCEAANAVNLLGQEIVNAESGSGSYSAAPGLNAAFDRALVRTKRTYGELCARLGTLSDQASLWRSAECRDGFQAITDEADAAIQALRMTCPAFVRKG